MKSCRFFCVWIAVSIVGIPAIGQDKTEKEIMLELNRIQMYFNSVYNNVISTQELEPIESQIAAFKLLDKRKEKINESLEDANKGTSDERKAKLLVILSQLRELERELKEDVLLPHQVDQMRFAEFEKLMLLNRGNIANVIQIYYEKEFKLTDEQKQKLNSLRRELDIERGKIQQEYNKKLLEVEAKAREGMSKIFTKEQIATIEKASGKKLVKKKSTDGSD